MSIVSPATITITVLVIVGVVSLGWYIGRGKKSLLAAVIGFTSLAAAILGGVLLAAGVPQAIFTGNKIDLANAPDAVWKVTQSVTLAFGALGVVAASVITFHRQRTAQEQVATTQQQLAHDQAKFEAEQAREIERSRQERYSQGAQMLADESPAVRIAGLNVITALGREVPAEADLRQTCINLICAYLRATSPARLNPNDLDAPLLDRKYRVAAAEACRLLPTLLEQVDESGPSPGPGSGLALDLRDVNLIDMNLRKRIVGDVRFTRALFTGTAIFHETRVYGQAWFDSAEFEDEAEFHKVRFEGFTGFGYAKFSNRAWFAATTFVANVSFVEAAFKEAAFQETNFARHAWFSRTTFNADAYFDLASFSYAGFDHTTFHGDALFQKTTFNGTANFTDATFARDSAFTNIHFRRAATFDVKRSLSVARVG